MLQGVEFIFAIFQKNLLRIVMVYKKSVVPSKITDSSCRNGVS